MTELLDRLKDNTDVAQLLAIIAGKRLSRADLCARWGCHRNTLAKRLKDGPKPGNDGKWLLSEVIAWENDK